MQDPILEKLCEENGLSTDNFLTEEELLILGKPDEIPEEEGDV